MIGAEQLEAALDDLGQVAGEWSIEDGGEAQFEAAEIATDEALRFALREAALYLDTMPAPSDLLRLAAGCLMQGLLVGVRAGRADAASLLEGIGVKDD